MWNTFPEPVMLLGKGEIVLAVNDLGHSLGVSPGVRCAGLTPLVPVVEHNHASMSRATPSAVVEISEANGQPVLSYWIPVATPMSSRCTSASAC